VILWQGQVYLHEEHVNALKGEPAYVQERYQAVVKALAPKPWHIVYASAATMVKRSLRQLYRIIARFKSEGIAGLRHRSRRPKSSPNRTPEDIEGMITAIREASGLGPTRVASLVNESLVREGRPERTCPSSVYNILVRNDIIERQRRERRTWRRFEWGHPDRLIQSDLTEINGVPVLTMEDDHSRKGWADVIDDETDDTVAENMTRIGPDKYDNLLTDNGPQFNRLNARMREYCREHVRESHIWASPNHPQTLGKLSALQKGLKWFVEFMLKGSRDKRKMRKWIRVYLDWYNNGRYHQGIKGYPEDRYSGQRDGGWYERFVRALKLEEVLTVARQTGDISP
jgi:hypothetical protein